VLAASIIRAMPASETSVNFYQTAQRYYPEDSHLHSRRRENLKSSLTDALFVVLWQREEVRPPTSDKICTCNTLITVCCLKIVFFFFYFI
jgi:hypothetical protein